MKDLQKEFVPYELALRMRELGFDYNILGFYYDNKLFEHCCGNTEVKDLEKGDVPAPTFSQAFRWFRKNHNLKGYIEPVEFIDDNTETYHWCIYNRCNSGNAQLTYEEAELACLEKLLEIVEEK